jgi:hypothetical protein
MHNPSIGFTLIFTLCYKCAFMCGSWMETSCIRIFPLQEYLVYPCDRAPSHDGGSMWFMLAIRFVALCETGWGN